MDYRKPIIDCLDRIEKLYGDGCTAELRQQVLAEEDPKKHFEMLQVLREEIAKETGESTGFTISLPNGQLYKAKDLADAKQAMQTWRSK